MKRFLQLLSFAAVLLGCETTDPETGSGQEPATSGGQEPAQTCANNEILYTTSDGRAVELFSTEGFDANIVSNTYENGQGKILFDGDVTTIGEEAFSECGNLARVIIPSCVTIIGSSAFWGCSSLTGMAIPDSVTEIEAGAFGNCGRLEKFEGKFASADKRCLIIDGVLASFAPAGLTEYAIPNGVTYIKESAFDGCGSLANVTIPDSVTEIAGYAFENCDNLASVTIGSGLTEIGPGAFFNCISLADVYCKPATPPACSHIPFYNAPSLSVIYVPSASVEAYKSAEGWSNHADKIVGYDF